MTHTALLWSFAVLTAITFGAFGMQRTTLLLAREADVPSGMTAAMLPAWFPLVWIPRIAKWGLVLYVGITWSWLMCVGLLATDFVVSSFAPIPHRAFIPAFRKRIKQLMDTDPLLSWKLNDLLNASQLTQ